MVPAAAARAMEVPRNPRVVRVAAHDENGPPDAREKRVASSPDNHRDASRQRSTSGCSPLSPSSRLNARQALAGTDHLASQEGVFRAFGAGESMASASQANGELSCPSRWRGGWRLVAITRAFGSSLESALQAEDDTDIETIG